MIEGTGIGGGQDLGHVPGQGHAPSQDQGPEVEIDGEEGLGAADTGDIGIDQKVPPSNLTERNTRLT